MRTRSIIHQSPIPSIPLSHLPSDDLRSLTRAVAGSPTRLLGQTERATLNVELGRWPSQSDVDRDMAARIALHLHKWLTSEGVHTYGGHSLARRLEGLYGPWGVRPTFDADRGWQLLTLVDASPVTGIAMWLEADPVSFDDERRHMRLHERVEELAARR